MVKKVLLQQSGKMVTDTKVPKKQMFAGAGLHHEGSSFLRAKMDSR